MICMYLLKGIRLNYGHLFSRHIIVKDPKTGKNIYINDDGRNIIDKDGTLTGRVTEQKADQLIDQ